MAAPPAVPGASPSSRVGEVANVGALAITAVEARHDGRRWPRGPHAASLGYLVSGTQTVYFAGDTELFDEMSELADRVDAALLPIGGWGPTLGPGHMDPLDAARAVRLIRPRVVIPVHWGTLLPIGFRPSPPGPSWRPGTPVRPARRQHRPGRRGSHPDAGAADDALRRHRHIFTPVGTCRLPRPSQVRLAPIATESSFDLHDPDQAIRRRRAATERAGVHGLRGIKSGKGGEECLCVT